VPGGALAPAGKDFMKLSTFLLMTALFGLLPACNSQCESQCEDRKECTEATIDDQTRDCEQYCSDDEAQAKAKGCETERDAMLDCLSDHGDICSNAAFDACASQVTALTSCEL
jgi:hypothetical protein